MLSVSSRFAFAAVAALVAAGPAAAQDTPPAAQNTPPAADAAADPGVFSPKRHDWSRYEKMADKSPFEFELIEGPAEEAPSPFADITLAGFAGSGTNITAFLVDSKKNERIPVYSESSGRKNDSGFRVISVNRGRSLRDTTVTLEKNGVVDTVGIDPALLSTMVAGGAAPVVPAAPGQPGNNSNRGRGRGRGPVQAAPAPTAARAPYQAPAAVVAGRNTTTLAGAQVQQADNPGNAGQNVNALVNNAGNPRGQGGVVVGAGGNPTPAANAGRGGRRREANQVRRRVVLPNAR